FEGWSRLDHRHHAVAASEVNLAVGIDRRRAVKAAVDWLVVILLARGGIDADQIVALAAEIDEAVVNEGAGHVGRAALATPQFAGAARLDLAACFGLHAVNRP